MAEVGIREAPRPAVENLREGRSLPASRWQVLLQDEHQDYIAFRGKVRHILGDDSSAFRSGSRGHLRVVSCPQAYLGHVDSVLAVGIAQQFGYGHRKHLIDQEGRHAKSASRCRAILRLRSAMPRLRSIRSRTSSECSAA